MKIRIPRKFQPLFKPKRFKIFYGGRGGAKTVSFSKILLSIAAEEKKRVLCLREFMNSINDSVHSSLENEVENIGLSDFYKVDKNKITGENGSLFRYAGLARNIASIKSKDSFDIAWIEEGETVSQKSLDFLIPTIRRNDSEIWISFNPDKEDAPIYKTFVLPFLDTINAKGYYEDDRTLVVKTNLADNPFAPQTLIDESNALKLQNYAKWLHFFGGECGGNYDDPVFEREWWQDYDVLPDYEWKAIFGDTALKDGEHNDYTVFQCWAKWRGRIYLIDQYRKQVKATELESILIDFWNKHKGTGGQPNRGCYVEDKASGIQLIQAIQQKGGIPIIPIPRHKSKIERANDLCSWIKSGLLYLPKNATWIYDYKNEFEQFSRDDSHRHDDQIDPTLDAIEHMLIQDAQIKTDNNNESQRPIAPSRGAKIW